MQQNIVKRGLAVATAGLLRALIQLITGARAYWIGCPPDTTQRIYYANHASHVDFVLMWATLSPALQAQTQPVAGSDYWEKGPVRRFFIHHVFNAVLINRDAKERKHNPIEQLADALSTGKSILIFPEGTRNTTDETLLDFKSGLYHLATKRPDVELVPVWIENARRVMPKGRHIPLPLLCRVHYGKPLHLGEEESKTEFLTRARQALFDTIPETDPAKEMAP